METLLVTLVILLAPLVLGVQLAKQYKISSLRTADDFVCLFFPLINWFFLIYCICEALEVWTREGNYE